mgnify:CR=1 FL=1
MQACQQAIVALTITNAPCAMMTIVLTAGCTLGCVCVSAGPRLGDGPRWDLRRADAAREEVVTREEVDKELEGHADLIKMRRYIEQLERENRSMREGSDARCSKMLGDALSGSEDGTDVVFVFGDGHGKVCGHRGMLCAGSEAFAGMFRSGMVEEQEGKINIPSVIGTAALRGLLEWVYLGEFPRPSCCVLWVWCLRC